MMAHILCAISCVTQVACQSMFCSVQRKAGSSELTMFELWHRDHHAGKLTASGPGTTDGDAICNDDTSKYMLYTRYIYTGFSHETDAWLAATTATTAPYKERDGDPAAPGAEFPLCHLFVKICLPRPDWLPSPQRCRHDCSASHWPRTSRHRLTRRGGLFSPCAEAPARMP